MNFGVKLNYARHFMFSFYTENYIFNYSYGMHQRYLATACADLDPEYSLLKYHSSLEVFTGSITAAGMDLYHNQDEFEAWY